MTLMYGLYKAFSLRQSSLKLDFVCNSTSLEILHKAFELAPSLALKAASLFYSIVCLSRDKT